MVSNQEKIQVVLKSGISDFDQKCNFEIYLEMLFVLMDGALQRW